MPKRGISKKNEQLLMKYLSNQGSSIEIKKGRPKKTGRPERSAAKRTLPGEERYLVTLKTDHVSYMKRIAESKGITIKESFAEAIEDYKLKFEKKWLVKTEATINPK